MRWSAAMVATSFCSLSSLGLERLFLRDELLERGPNSARRLSCTTFACGDSSKSLRVVDDADLGLAAHGGHGERRRDQRTQKNFANRNLH